MNKYRFKQERAIIYIVHKNQRKKTSTREDLLPGSAAYKKTK